MKIAICDDNAQLETLLRKYMSNNKIRAYIIKKYSSGRDLIKNFKRGLYDLIFLDVDMPEIDGFKTAEHIINIDKRTKIIFVSNMLNEVRKGYEYNAKGYIYKNAVKEELNGVMDRLLKEFNYQEEANLYAVNIKFKGTTNLYLPDVLYFESSNKYVIAAMTTSQKDTHTLSTTLDKIAKDLCNKGFVRISRTCIVNWKHHVYQNFGDFVLLNNEETLNIGGKYRNIVPTSIYPGSF